MATAFSSVISSRPLPIDVERRPPWNRWFFKLIHYWRYGYLHPDEDLLGVIEAAGDAIKVYAMAAQTELSGEPAQRATNILARLEAELNKTIPDFATLLGLEAEINALYPPELGRYRRWIIRERFERVASPGAVQSWHAAQVAAQLAQAGTRMDADDSAGAAKSGTAPNAATGGGTGGGSAGGGGGGGTPPPAPPPGGRPPGSTGDGSSDQGEVQALLSYVHSNYLLSIAREKAVRDLKRWLLMRFWFFLSGSILTLAALGGILVLAGTAQYWGLALGLFLVAIAGRMGATTSVIRRMQNAISGNVLARDPILELTALRTGKNEISLALLTSSIFALLLYGFFLTGVPYMLGFQEGVFPRAAATERRSVATIDAEPVAPASPPAAPAGDRSRPQPRQQNAAAAAPAAAPVNTAIPAPAAATAPTGNGALGETANSAAEAVPAPTVQALPKPPESTAPTPEETAIRELKLTCGQGVDCDPFDNLATMLGLVDARDFFKLLIWAFIAGFAERFVPDVLDRVVARGRGSIQESSGTLIAAQLSGNNPTGSPPTPPTPPPPGTGRSGEGRHAARPARASPRG